MVQTEIREGGGVIDVMDEYDGEMRNVLLRPQGEPLKISIITNGQDATVEHVGVEGLIDGDGVNGGIIYPQARDDNDTITVRDFHMSDGVSTGVDRTKGNLIFVNKEHAGLFQLEDSWLEVTPENPGEDTMYGSPPGHYTDAKTFGREGGAVQVRRCYSKNMGTSGEACWGWRFASSRSSHWAGPSGVYDTVMDAGPRCTGIGALYGQNMEVAGTDVRADGIAVRLGEPRDENRYKAYEEAVLDVDDSRAEGRIDVQDFTADRISGRINGSFGSNPDVSPPSTAPRSAQEAARRGEVPEPTQQRSSLGDLALLGAGLWAVREYQ